MSVQKRRRNHLRDFGADGVLLLLGIVALPWNAFEVYGVIVGDLFLGAASILILLRRVFPPVRRLLPKSMWVGIVLISVGGLITTAFPPGASYLASRKVVFTYNFIGQVRSTSALTSLLKYEVALLVLPILVGVSIWKRPWLAMPVMYAWLAGIVASSAVAATDAIHLTHISSSLLLGASSPDRQAGLTAQPNHLAIQVAMSIPLSMVLLTSQSRRCRNAGGLALVFTVMGGVLSGSRGGAVGIAVALVLATLLIPSLKRLAPMVMLALGFSALGLASLSVGASILKRIRLSSAAKASTIGSNQGRFILLQQGLRDFLHYPLAGIGWGYAPDAHALYVEVLAAGGILGTLGFIFYVGATLRRLYRVGPNSCIRICIACTLTWLIVGAVENQIADQYLYLPLAVAVAVLATSYSMKRADPVGEPSSG